jgi:hypothetical protein
MTSEKQAAANRANARRSTGPKTETGKEIAKLNAVKHGGLSPLPVLPEVETPDAWQTHLDGTLASLQPSGHLETVLAERIALILWRLNRVARFEREITAVGQERVVVDLTDQRERRMSYRKTGPDHPDELRTALREARHSLTVIAQMYRRSDAEKLSGEAAELVLSAVAAQTTEVDPEVFSMPEVVPDEVPWSQFDGWTVGRVKQGVAAMADAEGDGVTPDSLLFAALEHYRVETIKLKSEADEVTRDLDHLRRERLLASAPQTDRIVRYEAHLSRQLAQALHELQRLQAGRSGAPIPPPFVVDVTVSGTEGD